ncbi:MAG: TPM domain-containing protein, partial [Oscillospiraceae bacterium]|nr:TPM domain-containing protein [Oscillospiraceae bacterium]
LFNNWGVGSDRSNNGTLLLFATEENKGWLAVGSGIESDFDADRILDKYFWDYYDRGQYDEGVKKVSAAILDWYEDYYGTSYSSSSGSQSGLVPFGQESGSSGYSQNQGGYTDSGDSASGYITLIIFIVLVWLLVKYIRDRRRYTYYYSGMGPTIPRYHFWYMWGARPHRPYRPHGWFRPSSYNYNYNYNQNHRPDPWVNNYNGYNKPRPGYQQNYTQPHNSGFTAKPSGHGGRAGGGSGRRGSGGGGSGSIFSGMGGFSSRSSGGSFSSRSGSSFGSFRGGGGFGGRSGGGGGRK